MADAEDFQDFLTSHLESLVAEYEATTIDLGSQPDDAYRAIGRYVVEFSNLIGIMRGSLIYEITRDSGDRETRVTELAQLVLGEQTAGPIAEAFFAMCRSATELDD